MAPSHSILWRAVPACFSITGMKHHAPSGRKTESMQAIDTFVGQKIRWFRLQCGLSQHELAIQLGISYQQLHKYENGSNSASASRLADIARALGISVSHLFEGFGEDNMHWLCADHRDHLLLAKYYCQLTSDAQREAVFTLIKSLADE